MGLEGICEGLINSGSIPSLLVLILCVHMHWCGGQGATLVSSIRRHPPCFFFFFGEGSLIELRLGNLVRVVCHWVLGIPLPLLFQC